METLPSDISLPALCVFSQVYGRQVFILEDKDTDYVEGKN